MKKYLLSLLAFLSLQAMAMVEETVTFNFKQPLNLNINPPLNTAELGMLNDGDGVLVSISDRTITAGSVELSFSKPTGTSGAGISRYGTNAPFCLEMGRLLSLTFTMASGCVLTSITFDQDNDITLPQGQPGSWNYMTNTWTASDNSTTSVTLKNGDQSARIYVITVKYKRSSTPIYFVSSDPAKNDTVSGSFKTMTMNFSSAVAKVNNASNIKLTGTDIDGTAINETMTATLSGNSVSLSIANALVKDADLTVTAPVGTFENSEGATNQEAIAIPFKLLAKRDTFNPTKIEPDSGTWNELPREIKLTFPNYVKSGTGSIKFFRNGTSMFSVDADTVAVNNKVATITHAYTDTDVKSGKWTILIPEKAFHNDFSENDPDYRWNAAFTINYEIEGSAPSPQDSEIMKDAKVLLQKTGVGYPKHTDPAWVALNNLVNAVETPTDEALAAAMTDLYNATDVQLPEVDKWYSITGYNTTDKKIFLTLSSDKTKVVLGTDAAAAAAFKVKSVTDNKVVFETKEGLFLHIPTVLPQHEGTSDANLTGTESDINKLTFTKFLASSVENASPAALFGAFTIYGSLGKVIGLDVEDFAYAMLDFENTKIATYPNIPLKFDANMSSAFMLTETTEPSEVVDLIYPTVGFVPDAIDNPGDDMVMKINGPTSTIIADPSLIYYTIYSEGEDNGTRVAFDATILTAIPNQANTFKVNTVGLTPGMYNIVMENGAFTYTAPAGKGIRPMTLIGGPITIRGGSSGTDITPTVSLSKSELKAGDALILKIGNVGKAILKNSAAPYFEYADGENVGTQVAFDGLILTSKAGTTADFNVNTTGLAAGMYKLVMPAETFIFEAAQEGQTVKNVQLAVTFTILSQGGGPVDEGFQYVYDSYIEFFPASLIRHSGYFKDIDLNEMIIYVYSTIADGLVANPEKKVDVVTNHGGVATSGHFVNYTTFAQDYPTYYNEYLQHLSDVCAIKFVPETPLQKGDLDNWSGIYTYRCPQGTFGDRNYGKWLENPDSIAPSQCKVNPLLNVGSIMVYNSRVPTYTLSITATGNGSATYDETSVRNETTPFIVDEGANATIMFSPDDGNSIASVKVNNSDVTSQVSENRYTINNINANMTLTVTFQEDVTAISNHVIDGDSSKVIFDLQGRRVQNMNQKGVYIVNGQKVVIK